MRRVSFAEMDCPIARSLDVIGEWWTLLIVRDAIGGARRFDDFKTTGIADNILSARLKGLVADGVFERRRYQQHPDRYEYLLTEKGRALGPVVVALRDWGKEWTTGKDDSLRVLHEPCGQEVSVRMYCEGCGRALEAGDVRAEQPTATGDQRELFGASTVCWMSCGCVSLSPADVIRISSPWSRRSAMVRAPA
jgi:DNA-binding HxlR family transcriptional regulator